ncbi:putative iron-regulated membrane protein [Haloferula luteola]|uniref:Putative iron-regulated membrane protein n=1 Tax=Haloferula luteola TaxID=595692 RepID=A0A840VDX0_9BACT|nr:PepSY-associated TM helix domain-containing protein [Haloferula luteola]MBB5352828.1 putative iron-regulated membrane protein [Haloferula luteola]
MPPLLRKTLFWLHLGAGLAAGLMILIMATTGLLLSFERQITEAADGYRVEATGERLPLSELHARLHEAIPETRPTGFLLNASPTAPAVFQFGRERSVFVNPYTGAVLGEGATRTRAFFHTVTEIHRWLALQGAARDTARSVQAAAALVFLFILISGLFLWIPKRWTRKGLKAITTLQPRLKGRARDWNWHNALGIWFALPLIVIVSCGLVIAYPWANQLLFQAVGEKAPERKGPPGPARGEGRGPIGSGAGQAQGRGPAQGRGRGATAPPPEVLPSGLDSALAKAVEDFPEWSQVQFSFPAGHQARFFVSDSHRGRPDLRREVTIHLKKQEVESIQDFQSQTPGRRLRTWVRWVHTGEAGGWMGQTLAALSTLATLILIGTGFALSYRRFFRKRKIA